MDFRARLLGTLRAIRPVLRVPGVLVAGSEVPNLIEPDARSSLIVSQDVDIALPVDRLGDVKTALREVRGLARSAEEPSVWLPQRGDLIEVNFIGMDARGDTYLIEDEELPLLVFGHLSLLRPREPLLIEDFPVPVPRPAGLILEKLVTDRSGEKGDRDLLVALALLLVSQPADLTELERMYRSLPPEERYAVRSGLSVLSLAAPLPHMPDPTLHRERVSRVMARLERTESDG